MPRNDDDDDRRSRRSRDDDGDDRGSRSRDRDDDRGSRRSRDEDDDRGSSRRSRDDDGDRGSKGGSGYRYERRTAESVAQRAQKQASGDFDRLVKDNIKAWKPNDKDNRIRILPPTWKKPEHHGFDLKVHYGVGADRQSYLCLRGMKGEPDPIYEAYEEARRELNDDENNKTLKEYVSSLKAKNRVGVYLIDRDNEKEGVQFWAMPQGMDTDITAVMTDKRSGEVLAIDDPEEGYDIEFTKLGQGKNTEYKGVAIARRSSPLGKREWLEFAVENPIPDILQYYSYDHIAKAFGGKGQQRSERTRDDDDAPRGRSRDDDDRPSRDADDDRGSRSRDRDSDDRGGRSRSRDDDDAPRGRGRSKEDDEPTWESVHEMTRSELEDLIEQKDLDIKPKQAKDDEDLADWVCEEMKLKKAPKEEKRRSRDDDEGEDKLAAMRRRREERD